MRRAPMKHESGTNETSGLANIMNQSMSNANMAQWPTDTSFSFTVACNEHVHVDMNHNVPSKHKHHVKGDINHNQVNMTMTMRNSVIFMYRHCKVQSWAGSAHQQSAQFFTAAHQLLFDEFLTSRPLKDKLLSTNGNHCAAASFSLCCSATASFWPSSSGSVSFCFGHFGTERG